MKKKSNKAIVITEKKKKHAGGRRKLTDDEKKIPITLFFKREFVEGRGGTENSAREFKAYCYNVIYNKEG